MTSETAICNELPLLCEGNSFIKEEIVIVDVSDSSGDSSLEDEDDKDEQSLFPRESEEDQVALEWTYNDILSDIQAKTSAGLPIVLLERLEIHEKVIHIGPKINIGYSNKSTTIRNGAPSTKYNYLVPEKAKDIDGQCNNHAIRNGDVIKNVDILNLQSGPNLTYSAAAALETEKFNFDNELPKLKKVSDFEKVEDSPAVLKTEKSDLDNELQELKQFSNLEKDNIKDETDLEDSDEESSIMCTQDINLLLNIPDSDDDDSFDGTKNIMLIKSIEEKYFVKNADNDDGDDNENIPDDGDYDGVNPSDGTEDIRLVESIQEEYSVNNTDDDGGDDNENKDDDENVDDDDVLILEMANESLESEQRWFKEKCIKCNRLEQRINNKVASLCHACNSPLWYECLICHVMFKHQSGMCNHLTDEHGANGGKVKLASTHSTGALKKRIEGLKIKIKRGKSFFIEKCCNCNIVHPRINDRIGLFCSICKSVLSYECSICHVIYKNQRGMYRHILDQHSENFKAECPKCTRSFYMRRSYNEHLKICNVLPYIKCSFCSHATTCRPYLRSHLLRQHYSIVCKLNMDQLLKEIIEESQKNKKLPASGESNNSLKFYKNYKSAEFISYFCSTCNHAYDRTEKSRYNSCPKCSAALLMRCTKCSRLYKNRSGMYSHLRICRMPEQLERLKCLYCEFQCVNKFILGEHISKEHANVDSGVVLFCKWCDDTFRNEYIWYNHEAKCGKMYQCDLCAYKNDQEFMMKAHLNKHHSQFPIEERTFSKFDPKNKSDDDEGDFDTQAALNNMEIEVYCGKNMDQTTKNVISENIDAFCPKCKINTNKLTRKLTVCQICRTKLIYVCKLCLTTRTRYTHCRIHILRSHTKKKFACGNPGCVYKFSYYFDYSNHRKTCKANQKLQCENCNFKTKYKHIMGAHKRTKICCPRPSHKVQKRIISGNNKKLMPERVSQQVSIPYCKKCDKTFMSSSSCSRHVKNCGAATSFKLCDHCNFKTESKVALIDHIHSKHAARLFRGVSAFKCHMCHTVFKTFIIYDKHAQSCRQRDKTK